MKALIKASMIILMILAVSKADPVQAENIYIAQTAQGADTGSDCGNAHAVTWFNTAANWGSSAGKIGPGTTARICGTVSTSLMIRGSGAEGNPVTVLFEPDAKLSAPLWTGAWAGVMGAIQASNVNYIVLDGGSNGIIEATNSGTLLQQTGSQGIYFGNVSFAEIRNFTIRNMYVRTSTAGEDGGGTGIYIRSGGNNRIHHNRISDTQTALIYVYPQNGISSHVRIYNNTIDRTNWGLIVGESNNDALADDFQIYNNDIRDQGIWDDPLDNFHHDGIYVYAEAPGDVVTNLKVFNNFIHGDTGAHVTAMIFTSGNVVAPMYFNNVLINTGRGGISNGFICVPKGSQIFNNTIVDHSSSMGIYAGTGSNIQNNIIYSASSPIAVRTPVDTDTVSDHNVLFNKNGIQMVTFNPQGASAFYSLAQWRSNFSQDANSLTGDPLFINPDLFVGNEHLRRNSPAIGAGVNLTAVCAQVPELCLDRDGNLRPANGSWDLGAFRYMAAQDNQPFAVITSNKDYGYETLSVQFDASNSYNTAGSSFVNYAWDFGDGSKGSGAKVVHAFDEGIFDVTLTATDDQGRVVSTHRKITALHADLPNLAYYLPLDNATADASGRGRAVNVSGPSAAAYVPGVLGQALDLKDGTLLDSGSYPDVQQMDAFSFSLWAKKNTASTTSNLIFFYTVYTLSVSGSGFSSAVVTDLGTTTASVSTGTDNTDWHHYAVTCDGTQLSLFLDGALKTTVSYKGLMRREPYQHLQIGRDPWTSKYFDGWLDEVRIYDRALTAAEVLLLAQKKELAGSGSKGDVSGNGRVTMYDAALVLKYTVGGVLTSPQQAQADMNGDTTIDISDAAVIAKKALGMN